MASSHNILVFSDVHLGADLVQHARPGAPTKTRASETRDRELVALIDWYRERPVKERPWRLVIAGDLVDFAGMSVTPSVDELTTELNEEERRHGLGSSADHTLAKLKHVASEHHAVFDALSRFVAEGHSLVIVRGNHDVELHWEPVKAAFRDLVASRGGAERVEFRDWFYYEEGRVYIEHGHQYDSYCSYEHVLCPLRANDHSRSTPSLADVLLRYVVRPTMGMREGGHAAASAIDYVRFAAKLGLRGLLGLGHRFVVAIGALLSLWREHATDAARWLREEHERKMAVLSEARQISLTKLRALALLQRPPVTRSIFRLLAGVMVDRVAFAVIGVALAVFFLAARWTPALGVGLLVALALLVPLAWFWRKARGSIDTTEELRERAPHVVALLPTAFIVMGHTHIPEVRRMNDQQATYVNLGGWHEEEVEPDARPEPPSRTHFVLHAADVGDGTPNDDAEVGGLFRWQSSEGPSRYQDPGA